MKKLLRFLGISLLLATFTAQADALIGAVRAANRGACEQNLKAIGDLIGVYTLTEGSQLPAEDNAAGLEQFGAYSQCPTRHFKSDKETKDPVERDNSYIYFGGFNLEGMKDAAITPLVFDKPGNIHVNVLFADMHVESFKVENMKTVAQIIEYLNGQKKFPEKLLKTLQEKAAKVDEELGYTEEKKK